MNDNSWMKCNLKLLMRRCVANDRCVAFIWLGSYRKGCWLLSYLEWHRPVTRGYKTITGTDDIMPEDSVLARVTHASGE